MARNILFIMFDQLRWDYMSCAGHPHLHTPNKDRIAARGVRFTRAYVQSPICGASRMSFYTRRYCHSHGARRMSQRVTLGEEQIIAKRGKALRKGVLLGLYDGSEVPDDWLTQTKGKAEDRRD